MPLEEPLQDMQHLNLWAPRLPCALQHGTGPERGRRHSICDKQLCQSLRLYIFSLQISGLELQDYLRPNQLQCTSQTTARDDFAFSNSAEETTRITGCFLRAVQQVLTPKRAAGARVPAKSGLHTQLARQSADTDPPPFQETPAPPTAAWEAGPAVRRHLTSPMEHSREHSAARPRPAAVGGRPSPRSGCSHGAAPTPAPQTGPPRHTGDKPLMESGGTPPPSQPYLAADAIHSAPLGAGSPWLPGKADGELAGGGAEREMAEEGAARPALAVRPGKG